MNTSPQGRQTRPVSVPHLVLGIVFAGIAAIWFLGEATDAGLPRTAVGFPVVLIGAGVVGLVAIFANSRRKARPTYPAAETAETAAAPETEETTVLVTEPQQSTPTDQQEQS